MNEETRNEKAYNLKMNVKEGTRPNRSRRNSRMMTVLELIGNRKSNMNDRMDADSEVNWWMMDRRDDMNTST